MSKSNAMKKFLKTNTNKIMHKTQWTNIHLLIPIHVEVYNEIA